MLSAILTYQGNEFTPILIEYGFIWIGNRFVYPINKGTQLNVEVNTLNNELTFNYSNQLGIEEYRKIHSLLSSIQDRLKGTIYDNNSLLGYTETGEPAFIITNWSKWYRFIQKAMLTSISGKKVRVINETEVELASGLFVGYETSTYEDTITKCTLVTLFGEKTFIGKDLKIEATNEW